MIERAATSSQEPAAAAGELASRAAMAQQVALGTPVTTAVSASLLVGMFAHTPAPPYTAVIFTSLRTSLDERAYEAMAERMDRLARRQPGYLGIESARDPRTRLGITVSYWATETDARAWKQVAAHVEAQRLGRDQWYEDYQVRIASVSRAYGRGATLR